MEAYALTLVVVAASQSFVQQRVQALLAVVKQVVQVPWVEVYVPQQNWQWSALPANVQVQVAQLRAQVLSAGQVIVISDRPELPALHPLSLERSGANAVAAIQFYGGFPLGQPHHRIGVLSIASPQPFTLHQPQQQAIAILAEQIGDLLTPVVGPATHSATQAAAIAQPAPCQDATCRAAPCQDATFKDIYQSVMRLSVGLQRCLSFEDLNNQLITQLPQELPLQAFELTAFFPARTSQQICLWPDATVRVPNEAELVCYIPEECSDCSLYPSGDTTDGLVTHSPAPADDISLWRCYGLKVQNRTVGTLKVCLKPDAGPQFLESREILNNLANQIGATLYRLMLLRKLQAETLQDPLTQLFNRRHMMGMLGKLMQRVSYGHYQVGLIMLDLDHFKQLNDTYGHDAGDQVLRMLGLFLKGHARPNDVVCRFGGEEFAMILPGLTWEILERRATQLCRDIHYLSFGTKETALKITMSAGFAIAPYHAKTPSTLIKAADDALYAAKHQGRDRAVGAPWPGR